MLMESSDEFEEDCEARVETKVNERGTTARSRESPRRTCESSRMGQAAYYRT